MDMGITTRQKEILRFIENFQAREGFPPSVREICKAMGLSSAGSLIKHLRALELQGRLTSTPGKKRAWKLIGRSSHVSLPLVGRIAAGTPILAEENRENDLPVDPRLFGSEKVFALWVKGDSMIDADHDGDFAIIRPQMARKTAKSWQSLWKGWSLRLPSRSFAGTMGALNCIPPMTLISLWSSETDRAKVRILGKLVGIIRPRP
jgi:repressor LexA